MKKTSQFINWAIANGWHVELSHDKKILPDKILQRYLGIPAEYESFYEQINLCCNQSYTDWFLTETDFLGINKDAFAWDEFEKISLEAAGKDDELIKAIKEYWDGHLPIMLCVGGGYKYYAISLSNGAVVTGCEPEFEEAAEVAKSFIEFLDRITKGEVD